MARARPNWVFFCAVAWVLSAMAPRAQATYIVNFDQVGRNVVATGSGSINTAGLIFLGSSNLNALVNASLGLESTGPAPGSSSFYGYGGFSGPATFGSGGLFSATSGSGPEVLIFVNRNLIGVPFGYISNSALSDTSTYVHQTFSTLGLTVGTYTYTFGSGATADSFIVNIGVSAVPEPRTLVGGMAGLLGLGGMAVVRRRRIA